MRVRTHTHTRAWALDEVADGAASPDSGGVGADGAAGLRPIPLANNLQLDALRSLAPNEEIGAGTADEDVVGIELSGAISAAADGAGVVHLSPGMVPAEGLHQQGALSFGIPRRAYGASPAVRLPSTRGAAISPLSWRGQLGRRRLRASRTPHTLTAESWPRRHGAGRICIAMQISLPRAQVQYLDGRNTHSIAHSPCAQSPR